MRIDPAEVFAHTVVSVPLRVCLVWVVGTVGSFMPVVIAFFSGWWAFVALPLLLAWTWRVVVFLREDGLIKDLFWIFMLPYLIAIRASQDAWPWAALIAAVAIFLTMKSQNRAESRADL